MSASPETPGRAAWPATPVLLKRDEGFEWPEDRRMFYLLASTGLYRCRNHEFFKSCVPVDRGPGELARQEPFLECGFPRIPQALFERVVGFFDRIRRLHNSEASVLLAFDRERRAVEIVVPQQVATVIRYADGWQHPIGLHYFPPLDLPPGWIVFGDVHSHGELAAYSSATDVHDETHGAGLHIVVGRLQREPAETHVEAVVDGQRFALELADVVEGYRERSLDVPRKWIERVSIEASPARSSSWCSGRSSGSWSSSGWARDDPDGEEERR